MHSAAPDVERNSEPILLGIEDYVQVGFEEWENQEKLEGRRFLESKVNMRNSVAPCFGIEGGTVGCDCIAVAFVDADDHIDHVSGD